MFLPGIAFFQNTYESFYASNTDFPSDAFGYNLLELGKGIENADAGMGSDKGQNRLIAFFGRLNYNYDDRYLLSASFRREGSTKFGKDNKWGNFPAVSAAWRISQESWFVSGIINELKLRAGYGITGSEPYSPYMSQLTFEYMGVEDQFYYNGEFIKGVKPAREANPNLKWEEKAEFDLGLDIALFKNKISATLDYYQRKTTDMIWNYDLPSPPNFATWTLANVGELENKGFEVSVTAIPVRTANFDWSVSINYANNKNKILSLSNDLYQLSNDYFDVGYPGNPIQTTTHRVQEGQPIGNFWGFTAIDLDSAKESGYMRM